MNKAGTILVTGATGQQGGSVASTLLNSGITVRALTRNPNSDKAVSLRKRGAEVVQGDFTDRPSLERALKGVSAAYLVCTPFEAGIEAETEQGWNFVEAAIAAELPYLVYSSVSDADRNSGIPHFESKYRVEQRIVEAGLNYSILAPVFFADNLLAPFVLPGLQNGMFAQALPADRALQSVTVKNIGEFAVLALTRRVEFAGKRINIAGDALTGLEYARKISEASGRDIGYMEIPIDQVRQMSEDMALMYEWFGREGYSADVEALRRDYPEMKWERFEDWAARQDWAVLDAAKRVAS